eukprot:COSAG06_NODE_841_length_11989_cov_4.537763_11_plen_122_part_00
MCECVRRQHAIRNVVANQRAARAAPVPPPPEADWALVAPGGRNYKLRSSLLCSRTPNYSTDSSCLKTALKIAPHANRRLTVLLMRTSRGLCRRGLSGTSRELCRRCQSRCCLCGTVKAYTT